MTNNICVIDTETTGLGRQASRKDAIVEVGAVIFENGNRVAKFNSICNPGEEYFLNGRADYALQKNGLSLITIRSSPPIQIVAHQLRLLLKEHSPLTVFSYNVQFEQSFLNDPPWSFGDIEGLEWGPCIMLHTAEWLGERGMNVMHWSGDGWKWPKQVEAAERLGIKIDYNKAHSAYYDAKVAYEIAKRTGLL